MPLGNRGETNSKVSLASCLISYQSSSNSAGRRAVSLGVSRLLEIIALSRPANIGNHGQLPTFVLTGVAFDIF
jgi:hypothetical protein